MTEMIIPRLAVGSHAKESGVGCVMNLMCWVKQPVLDGYYGDNPPGWGDGLQNFLISANDAMCDHRTLSDIKDKWGDTIELNCPGCSMQLLDAAFALHGSDWLLTVTRPCEFRCEDCASCDDPNSEWRCGSACAIEAPHTEGRMGDLIHAVAAHEWCPDKWSATFDQVIGWYENYRPAHRPQVKALVRDTEQLAKVFVKA